MTICPTVRANQSMFSEYFRFPGKATLVLKVERRIKVIYSVIIYWVPIMFPPPWLALAIKGYIGFHFAKDYPQEILMQEAQFCCSVLWPISWEIKYIEKPQGQSQQEAWHPALGTCQTQWLLNLRMSVWDALIKNPGSRMPNSCQPREEKISLG